MKKQAIKKMILLAVSSSVVLSVNNKEAHAAWRQDSNNKWHWTENGSDAKGWKSINGKWYYFYSTGEMATGWVELGNKWYCLDSSGAMVTGWKKHANGKWYYLGSNGAMETGWILTGGKWYYLDNSGAMVTGWLELNGNKYYLEPSGAMVTGKVKIEGKEYTFNNNGHLTNSSSSNSNSSNNNSTGNSNQSNTRKTGYVATDSSPLNMRSEPSTNSNIIASIPKNSEVTVIGNEVNGFYKIEYNNKTGYASSKWITFTKPQTNTSVTLGPIRTTGPETTNKYYYSDDNIFYKAKLSPPFTNNNGSPIVGNCTWYSYGRIWEITGHIPYDAGFTGNAYEWWNANLRTGKYKYGSTPKKGALAVWKSSLPNSGRCGHVAIVEKIENNKIYISESSWHGSYFKYREIYNTEHLYGYIYIDEPNF